MSPFLFISLGFILNMILVSDALLSVWKFKFEIFLLIKTASWEYLPPLRDSYQRQGDREEEKAGLKFPHCQPMRTPVIWRQPMTERILKWSTFNQYFWDWHLTSKKTRSSASPDNITVLDKNIASCPAIIFPLLVR